MTSTLRLFHGEVTHRRFTPKQHLLRHRLFMILIDLDRVAAVAGTLRLFSLERFNWLTWRPRDHGDGSLTPLRDQIGKRLAIANIAWDGATIALLTMPRVLGFVFNPLSVFLCRNRDGELAALVYEVSNTFGERHYYLFQIDPGMRRTAPLQHSSAKTFFVSPLLPMNLDYEFSFLPPCPASTGQERLDLRILARDHDKPVMSARLEARGRTLTDASILQAMLACPMMTAGVVLAIHWQALRLLLKGVPYLGRWRSRTARPAPARKRVASGLGGKRNVLNRI